MAVRVFGTRLTVEGGGQYEQAMRRAGRTGQDAMDRVQRSTQPASRGLRLVSAASTELRGALDGVAGRVPVIGRLSSVLGPAGLAMGALAAAGGAAFAGIARGAKTAASEIAAIGDAADRAQIDAGTFEQLKAALTLEGQQDSGLEVALATFVRQMGEAQGGAKATQAAFQGLGISMAELARLTPEEAIMAVADGLAAIPDPASRAATAQRLFGEQGRALLTILDDGSAALRDQFKAAEDLGLLYGGDVIRSAQALNIEFDRQAKIIDVQLKSAFIEAGPAVVSLRENFVELIPVILNFVAAVTAGINELLALLALADRPKKIQLGVNVEELRTLQQQIVELEDARQNVTGPGTAGILSSLDETLDGLRARERDLLEANGRISQQIRQQEELLESTRTPPAITVALPELPASGGGRGGGGGGGRAARDGRDVFAEEQARVAERIAALQREAQAAGLAAEAAARLEAAYRLETAARADDNVVSEEERRIIDELVALYGTAAAAKERAAQTSRDLADADRDAAQATDDLKRGLDDLGQSASGALAGLISGTRDWRDALGEVLQTALRIAETQLTSPEVADRAGGFLNSFLGSAASFIGGLFADGAAFHRGRVVPFAAGGLVTGPTFFPMAGGRTGMMGERPPGEAIMPLVKTPSGALGVRAEGGGGTVLNFTSNVDARGSTMTAPQYAAIARAEAQRAVQTSAGASVRNLAFRQRS